MIRKKSAATMMFELARADYRFARLARTDTIVAFAADGSRARLSELPRLLDRAYADAMDTVAPPGTAERTLDLLTAGELPIEEAVDGSSNASDCDRSAEQEDRREQAARLRAAESVLSTLDADLRADGFAGDTSVPQLVYLSLCTAFLDIGRDGFAERMASVKVDGASSSGKNFAVDSALQYVPSNRVVKVTGMSQKALVYGEDSLERRFLYFPEGAGIRDDSDAAIYLRSLLSEGEIRYEVVVPQPSGPPIANTIVRSGPTAAIITTSAVRLDNDLDNRLLRATIDDSEELTRRILERHGERAAGGGAPARSRTEWHAFFDWLMAQAPIHVRVPFGPQLTSLIPASAVRLRRDVQTVFTLTAAHTALHLDSRECDADGYLLAAVEDYEAVRALVDPILGANVEQLSAAWERETWAAVPESSDDAITYSGLGKRLGIGTDAARTRALRLEERGQVTNLETRWKRPAKLVRGAEVPVGSAGFLPRLNAAGEASRTPEHNPAARATTRFVDPADLPERRSEPNVPGPLGTSSETGSTAAPEPRNREPRADDEHDSADLVAFGASAARNTSLRQPYRKPSGVCHVCEQIVGDSQLTDATLYGGRVRACLACLQRWSSIKPIRRVHRPRNAQLETVEFDPPVEAT